ncbi:MAG: acetyl-CoA carboxylase biotin carboxyl carrier protein [Planctomycetaceae bacterium]|jgi:acetyl-CoA carboxylase biotin carboxyl carrier protein|nr:acetyl-CoA carboxylase biotin carboxyl carrier protein [Planctomycetaceae bacterium]
MDSMSNDTFDLKRVKQLVELMKVNDLTDLEIKQGEWEITLRRGSQRGTMPDMSALLPTQSVPVTALPAATAAMVPPKQEEMENTTVIKSPMVGTFYSASSPDSPPFTKVGDTVTPEKTVCLIEAMKVYNEIQAECSGKIVAVLVKNGDTVEFGKPLFRVAVG